MLDEMSMPEERSVDFKLSEFGAKNLKTVVVDSDQMLINKIKASTLDAKVVDHRSKALAAHKMVAQKYTPLVPKSRAAATTKRKPAKAAP